MITKQEALDTIAIRHGYSGWAAVVYRDPLLILGLIMEAMDYYTEQSNSHKHSVMQGLALKIQNCPPDILEIVERNWDKLITASPTVADGAAGKTVSAGCKDKTRSKDGPCKYKVGSCDECQAP